MPGTLPTAAPEAIPPGPAAGVTVGDAAVGRTFVLGRPQAASPSANVSSNRSTPAHVHFMSCCSYDPAALISGPPSTSQPTGRSRLASSLPTPAARLTVGERGRTAAHPRRVERA